MRRFWLGAIVYTVKNSVTGTVLRQHTAAACMCLADTGSHCIIYNEGVHAAWDLTQGVHAHGNYKSIASKSSGRAGARRQTCSDKLALIRVIHCSLEQGVSKEAAAAMKGGEIPDDAAAVTAGSHALIPLACLHLDAVHCTLVLLQHQTHGTSGTTDTAAMLLLSLSAMTL